MEKFIGGLFKRPPNESLDAGDKTAWRTYLEGERQQKWKEIGECREKIEKINQIILTGHPNGPALKKEQDGIRETIAVIKNEIDKIQQQLDLLR